MNRKTSANKNSLINHDSLNHGHIKTSKAESSAEEYNLFLSMALLFLLAVVCFGNSYNAEFAFDDSEAVINNKDVTMEKPIFELFFHDFWGGKLLSNTSHKSYRPFTVLTFRLNYWLVGGLHPTIFHVCNIILHCFVSVFLLPFFSVLLSDGRFFKYKINGGSFLCAALFAVHPVHTESVAAVVGRADLLCALFFISSFLLYAYHVHNDTSYHVILKWMVLLLSMLLVACSVLFKEQGITVLGVCCFYDLIIVNRVHINHVLMMFKTGKISAVLPHTNILAFLVRQSILFLTGIFILIVRWQLMGSKIPSFQIIDNPHSFVENAFLRILNYNYIYSLNMWLLLNPWWLCFDWSMGCVPVIESCLDPRIAVVVVFWISAAILLKAAIFSMPSTKQRLLLFSLLLMLLPFLPASNLFFRVGFVIAERNLYLPSLGFILLVVAGIQKFQKLHSKCTAIMVVFLIVINTYRCILRSSDWMNERMLFNSGVKVCPLNAKVHYNVAKLQADDGHIDQAIANYRLAIRLNSDYDQAMNNLGNIYKDIGNHLEAETLLSRAVAVRPKFAAGWMNLGIVQADQKSYTAAEQSYNMALKHRRNYPDCYYNLGNLYLEQKRYTEALQAWREAVVRKPTHLNAWTNSMLLLDNLERTTDVMTVAEEALKHNPLEPSIHFSYASSLGKAGHYELSEKHFLLAIKYRPNHASYHSNLGVLYHRWGKTDAALKAYNTALQLEPGHISTVENLAMLQKTIRHRQRS